MTGLMRRTLAGLALAISLLAAPPLLAPDQAHAALLPIEQPAPEPSAAPQIEAQRDEGQDARIAERITGIFSEVPSLAAVSAEVDEGVVTLSGLVVDVAAANRAAAIASRVTGVVTVENNIERDLSVDGGLGLGTLGERVSEFTRMLPLIGAALLVGLLIAGLGYALASLSAMWRRVAPNSFLAELIATAIRFVFVVGGLVIALDMIGAGALLGAVLGGAGLVGIALGFAMRETVENYVASLMLSVRQPFRANDWLVIDQHEGRVIRLTSRATILMTLDGNHLRIPNSAVFKAVILNYTRNPERRFDFTLGVDADDDPTAARRLGVEVLRGLDFVLDHPEPQARVEQVGDSNIVIKYLAWINQEQTDWYKARSRAIPAVMDALEAAGFAIPEPIYRLRFDSPPSVSLDALAASAAASGQRGVRGAAEREAAPQTEPETAPDTMPADEIARMVDEERATMPADKDLLDPARPVE